MTASQPSSTETPPCDSLESIIFGIYDQLEKHDNCTVDVVLAPATAEGEPDWDKASPATVESLPDDVWPDDDLAAKRVCVIISNVAGCDPDSTFIVRLDPETRAPEFVHIHGTGDDRIVAEAIVARDIGAAAPPPPKSKMMESLAKLAEKFERETEERHRQRVEAARLTSFNARDLMGMDFEPVRYIVPGYIAEGCTILAGASKLGKSWLVLQAALAVASGGTCLGGQCEQGDVLYLALEDNPRRLKDRLRKQNPAMGLTGQKMPACLQFETEWPRADQGGLQKITDWLAEHPNARLVIIDVLKMFRANRKGNKNPYDLDYEDIGPLSKIAAEFNVAIVIVHHTNKGALSSDPFDRVNGTGGISGAADTTLIMARNDQGLIELYGRGREIEEIETAVSFDKMTCTWSVKGNASEVSMSDTAAAIMRVLSDASEPMGPTDIAAACGHKAVVVRQHLPRLAKDGKIEKTGRGKWTMAGKVTAPNTPITFVTTVTSDTPSTHADNDNDPQSNESNESNEGGVRSMDDDIPAFLKRDAA